jgi:hypothetical protein
LTPPLFGTPRVSYDRGDLMLSNLAVLHKPRSNSMFTGMRLRFSFLALICIAFGPTPDRAAAVTAEVARKCQALTARAYPPREPGNPAAGSAKGTGRSQKDYFDKCVANGGRMDDNAAKQAE